MQTGKVGHWSTPPSTMAITHFMVMLTACWVLQSVINLLHTAGGTLTLNMTLKKTKNKHKVQEVDCLVLGEWILLDCVACAGCSFCH